MIKGVLFDMDGVLVDSEEYICKAAIMMFHELGIKAYPADFKPFVGMGENRYIGGVADHYRIAVDIEKVKARTYELYKIIVTDKLVALPGAHEFIARCRNKGFKLALATSADRVKMEINLKGIRLTAGSFDFILTGSDVVHKKPSPEIYLKAAEGIGLKPEQCLVVEDAISGIKSGKSAGCRCLAVTTSFKRSELQEADWICGSLLEAPDDSITW